MVRPTQPSDVGQSPPVTPAAPAGAAFELYGSPSGPDPVAAEPVGMVWAPQPAPPPVPIQQVAYPGAAYPGAAYPAATVGTRFAAHLLDGLVMTGAMLAFYVVMLLIGLLGSALSNVSYELGGLVSGLLGLVALAGYVVILLGYLIWGWANGQTLGKRALKIAVVDAYTAAPIGYSRAIVRYLMMVVMGLPCYLGYLSILAADGRGWHDRAANSRVVVCPNWPAPVPPWKH